LSEVSKYFSIAAGFGNVHGVYKPGNVKLRPELLQKHQQFVKEKTNAKDDKPVFLVFHGGSGSSVDDFRQAISYGVVKVNLDTDMQWAYLSGVRDYVLNKKDYLMTQVGNPDGEDKPNKVSSHPLCSVQLYTNKPPEVLRPERPVIPFRVNKMLMLTSQQCGCEAAKLPCMPTLYEMKMRQILTSSGLNASRRPSTTFTPPARPKWLPNKRCGDDYGPGKTALVEGRERKAVAWTRSRGGAIMELRTEKSHAWIEMLMNVTKVSSREQDFSIPIFGPFGAMISPCMLQPRDGSVSEERKYTVDICNMTC